MTFMSSGDKWRTGQYVGSFMVQKFWYLNGVQIKVRYTLWYHPLGVLVILGERGEDCHGGGKEGDDRQVEKPRHPWDFPSLLLNLKGLKQRVRKEMTLPMRVYIVYIECLRYIAYKTVNKNTISTVWYVMNKNIKKYI
jgi:hypothetical protein